MFALISQLPPDSPRCRAPRRRGGRSVPAQPRRARLGTGTDGRGWRLWSGWMPQGQTRLETLLP